MMKWSCKEIPAEASMWGASRGSNVSAEEVQIGKQ